MKRLILFLLSVLLCCSLLTGCRFGTEPSGKTRMVTDSCGRPVEVPEQINRIAPSGSYAQIVLYTICPEKLCALSSEPSRVQKTYLTKLTDGLPALGHFYGTGNTISYESLLAADPDVIVDVGDYKENIAQDLDTLQEETGIPVLFVQADLEHMADAYDFLGDILGKADRTDAEAAYIRQTLEFAAQCRQQLTQETTVTGVYVQGEYGLEVNGVGSSHAEVLDIVGVRNVAQLGSLSAGGGDEVTMDQMLLWNPDVVIISPDGNFEDIFDDPLWQLTSAVKNNTVYEVPLGPYNWLDRPPSVQRILGIWWLGNLIYPELYQFNMVEKAQDFYRLFWGYELSEAEAEALLANSTLR